MRSQLDFGVFSTVDLGWLGRIGTATAVRIAVIVFVLQAVVATLWLRTFRYGPVEWAWRSLTFGRVAPWRVAT